MSGPAARRPEQITCLRHFFSPHVVFVLDGELWVGDAGATLFEVMMGDPRSWSDAPETLTQALAEHGAEPLRS